jgi:hypothetical protein
MRRFLVFARLSLSDDWSVDGRHPNPKQIAPEKHKRRKKPGFLGHMDRFIGWLQPGAPSPRGRI